MARARRTPRPKPDAHESPEPRGAEPLVPPGAELVQPRAPYLVPALLLLVARAIAWASLPLAAEDAYITFRFSRNLASGNGLVYNPGERVMGFSSPLWALWNALGFLLTHDPVLWSRSTSVIADLTTLIVVTRLLDRHASRGAAWCFAVFFAIWPYFAAVTASGMENPAFLALIALGAALAVRGSRATGPALGALALMRPEGLFSAAVISIWARPRDRILALLVLAAGVGALWAYFGSPIPQSVIAKSKLYGTPGPWAGRLWWDWIIPFRVNTWPEVGELVMLLPIVVVIFAAAGIGLQVVWEARRSALAAMVAAALTVWLGYATLGVAYFYWYFLAPLAAAITLASAGMPRMVRGRAIYASLLLYILGVWTIARILYVGRAQNEAQDFDRVATFLAAHARPGQTVMLEPIGIVGYRNPLRVVDEVGLVTPAVAKRRLEGPGWYTDIARAEHPDWLVTRRGVLKTGAAFAGAGAPFRSRSERDQLFSQYALADSGSDPSSDNALMILQRAR